LLLLTSCASLGIDREMTAVDDNSMAMGALWVLGANSRICTCSIN
jgi:hypothetical protein